MAKYTKLNLREEVEDQAPKFGMSGLEFRSARVPLEMENAGMSFQRLDPNFRVVSGYQAVMPTFLGQISDGEIDEITEYIKSLKE